MNKMIEWKPCEGCRIRGTKWITHNVGTDDEYTTLCTCYKDHQAKVITFIELDKAKIPNSILDYDIQSYRGKKSLEQVAKIRKYAKEFKEKFSHVNLYMYGPNSTQKTTLAFYVGRELIKREYENTVYYVLMDKMIKDLISINYGIKEEESKIVDQYKNSDLLIIDEAFDRKRLTLYKSGFQIPFLDSFLRDRLERSKKATIFISNQDIGFIEGTFGQGLFELISRNTIPLLMEDRIDVNEFDTKNLWK